MVRALLHDDGLPIIDTTYRQVGMILDPLVSENPEVPSSDPDYLPHEVITYSGDLIYLENRTPITRAKDQTETVRLTIEF